MIKIVSFLLWAVFLVSAQTNVTVVSSDSTKSSFSIDQLKTIVFVDTIMRVANGQSTDFSINAVRRLVFDYGQIPTPIAKPETMINAETKTKRLLWSQRTNAMVFQIAVPSNVMCRLGIFSPDGRLLKTFRTLKSGRYVWDYRTNSGARVTSGCYMVRLEQSDGMQQSAEVFVK